MLKEKDYCDYETCVALKELGFDDVTHYYFNKDGVRTPRIPLYEAQKFLREEKGIFVCIAAPWKTDGGLGWSYFCCNKPITDEDQEVCIASGGFYDSYEEALAEGVKCAVKILKEE